MTKGYLNNRNETKSDVFSWDKFKSDTMFRWPRNTKIFH